MKNIFLFALLFCCILGACNYCDVCCEDCGKHGECDPASTCFCDEGYATLTSEKYCEGYSRRIFIGEWEAKDTLCSDSSCRFNPYTVTCYAHPTDSLHFYTQNLAKQLCNNPDSAIWLVSASDSYVMKFEHISQTFPVLTVYTNWYKSRLHLRFYAVTGNDTLAWTTILQKK